MGDDVEEPSKLVTRLPSLPSAKGGDAAVVAGDWLAQLEPSMSSLSSTAATWWSSLMERVKDLYGLWLESAPVARLTIRQQVLTRRPPPDRHHRVEQRAAMLLLGALPEELRHEAVSARAVTAEAMVFMVHCAYQPGGAGEKAHLLQFLTVPETGNGLENTLLLARKWIRLFRRGRELQVVLPDPSLLCRGLDKLVSATFSGNKHPSASFRIASFRLERQLEYRATAVDIEDYAYLILGELEAAQLAQPLPSQPKVARLDDHAAAADEKDKDRDKGKGKAKGKKPCWGWQDGTGCRFGANCLFLHAPLGPGRCWECGSDAHLKPQCPLLGQGGKASGGGAVGSGKGSGGAAQSANAGQNSSSTSSTAGTAGASVEEKPPRKPKRKGGGKDRGPKEAVRKTEEETLVEDTRPTASGGNVEDASARTEFFEEATKALKSLRLAKLTMKSLQGSFGGGGRALIDSGATTSMRTAREGEVRGLPLRTVLLAEGETTFYQLPGGTLLTTKVTAPIVAMSDLMEIGCRITWCSSEGCSVVHPVKGDLGARVINGCPEVDEDVGLKLIEEAEITKLRRREAELAVNRLVQGCDAARCGEGKLDWELGAKAVKDLGNGVGLSWAWLRQAFPEAPSWLVAAVPVVAETDGAGVPWNRHERKKWKRASAVAVHLFCGRDRSTWRSRAEAAHVVLVDQAENVMADATYSALLELAASGKVKTVFGGPPCRTFSALRNLPTAGAGEGPRPLRDREGDGRWGRQGLTEWETWRVRQDTIMVFRMIFLWMVAAATARANGERDPDFIMEHPEDPQLFLKEQNMTSLWAFPEIQFLRDKLKWCWWQFDQGPLGHPRRKPTRILSSMPCPRELRDVRGPSTVTEEERDHDGDGFHSATWAAWAPGLKRAIKLRVEESLAGSTLEKIMKLDQTFLDHLRRDHVPFRRDCKACLAGSFRGHAHRRIVSPEAWCLSLDVIGPTRQGTDEYVKKVRYALIGTLVVPDMLGKLLQPADGDSDDRGEGVGPIDYEDPLLEDGAIQDEEEVASAAEEARNEREMAKWKARVEKDKLEGVSCVEVPFVVTMATKSSAEVLAATKDILVQVKRLGLVVQRIHSDRGREFICKGFRALCRDRGIVWTTTTGDDDRANGRVEALVGRAKNAVRTYLSASGMSNDMWGFAMRHYVSRIQHDVVTQLGGRFPRLPPFGTKVFVKQRSWKLKKEEFIEKVVAAYVLCPSMDVAKGFLVKTIEGSYLTTMVAVENVREVSGSFEVDAPPAHAAAHADEPGVRRRMRGKTAIAVAEVAGDSINKLGMSDEEYILKDEELAASFIDKGDYSLAAVEEFLDRCFFGATRCCQPSPRGDCRCWPRLGACAWHVPPWRSGWGDYDGPNSPQSDAFLGGGNEKACGLRDYLH